MENVTALSITGRAGIARTYDYRIQRSIQKTAIMRSTRKDCSTPLDTIRKEAYGGAIRDFESRSDALKKETERERRRRRKQGRTKTKRTAQKRTATTRPRRVAGARSAPATTGQTGANNKKPRKHQQRKRRRKSKRTRRKIRKRKRARINPALLPNTQWRRRLGYPTDGNTKRYKRH